MSFRKSILIVLLLSGCVAAQNPPYLPQATTEAVINGKKVSITYGRPSINGPALAGHDLFSVAPVGFVWRFGRNEATFIESTGNLEVGGKELPAGKYTLWARRLSEDKWVISFHPKTEDNGKPLWGDVPGGKAAVQDGFIADVALTPKKTSDKSEFLDIKLSEDNGKALITVRFGNVAQTGTFGVK
ncbi:MAG TPA: DUF2911 domain-containing protein [Blastocatellia bacterium]|nr:DUF2911 domain-containing protein [Blastocatellia bacterium]